MYVVLTDAGNEEFFRLARPHKGFRRGVQEVGTSQAETCGERSKTEKGPFPGGN
jgi:hypothetical protein